MKSLYRPFDLLNSSSLYAFELNELYYEDVCEKKFCTLAKVDVNSPIVWFGDKRKQPIT